MKSFSSVICLSHVYGNVVTGTISIAIISLQLQLPKDYLNPHCSMHKGEAVGKRDLSWDACLCRGQTLHVSLTLVREVEATPKAAKVSRKTSNTLGSRDF